MKSRHRRRSRRSLSLSRGLVIRLLLVAAFVVIAGGVSIMVSGANLSRSGRPEFAMTMQPWDARAHARAAEMLMMRSRGDPRRLGEVEQLSREALRRDPTVVLAWRMLGLVAVGRNRAADAAAMFHFAGRLSKRDLPTQLWLIEERVQANDINGALRHYDAALRTNTGSYELLFPILAGATTSDDILPQLAALLNNRPPWRRPFLERLASTAPDPDRLVRLVTMISRTAEPEEREILAAAMRTMIERRQYPAALRAYNMLTGADPRATALLRNGSFETANTYPPLDWQIENGADVRAEMRPAGREGSRLHLYASNGAAGVAARQLMLLPPGDYEVSAQAGTSEDGRPAHLNWKVQCANTDGNTLLLQDFPRLASRTAFTARFRVPQGCAGQWLILNVRSDFDPGGVAGWIDQISVRRPG